MCAATAGDGAALASAPSSTDRRPTSAECGVRPSSALSSSCMGRGASPRASGVPWSGCRSWCPSGEKNPGAPHIEAAITQRLQVVSVHTAHTNAPRYLGGVRADDVQVSLNYVPEFFPDIKTDSLDCTVTATHVAREPHTHDTHTHT